MTATKDIYKPFFEEPAREFTKHLTLDGNYRTILSGKYGIGKTEFLKYYFAQSKQEEYDVKYKAIHLYPVNYQIAENSDILEYIKYDIINHLLSVEDIELEKNDVSIAKTLPYLLCQRPADLIAPLLYFCGGAGKAYEKYRELAENIRQQQQDIRDNDQEYLIDLLKEAEQQKGSIYENDFYTQLITTLLQRWSSKSECQIVLIIDDLDRLDPHHMFRLLNVFAAHLDAETAEEHVNKFGFDKVVFVCDIQNIRSLFSHSYGVNADFNGYINKFYSKEVFYYNPIPFISKSIRRFVKNVDNKGTVSRLAFHQHRFDTHLQQVINLLLVTGGISMRTLVKRMSAPLTVNNHSSRTIHPPDGSRETLSDTDYLFIYLLNLLVDYTGSAYETVTALKKCEKYVQHRGRATIEVFNNIRNTPEVLTRSLLAFFGTRQKDPMAPNSFLYEFEEIGYTFRYQCTREASDSKPPAYGFSHVWDEKVFDRKGRIVSIEEATRHTITLLRKALEYLIEVQYYQS